MSGSSSSHLRTESELYGHTWPGTTRAVTQNCPSLKAKCTRTPICSAVMFVVDSMSRPEGKHFLHHDKGNLKRRKRQGLHACLRLRGNQVSSRPAGSTEGSEVV